MVQSKHLKSSVFKWFLYIIHAEKPRLFAMYYYEKIYSPAELQGQFEAKSTKACTQICQHQAAKYNYKLISRSCTHQKCIKNFRVIPQKKKILMVCLHKRLRIKQPSPKHWDE